MHPLIFLAALINTCGSSSSRDETAEEAQTHGGNPFCWEGAYDYNRCCIARDASCWSGGFLDWESCCLDPDKAVFISPECHTIAANHFFICGNEELEGSYQQRKSISYWMYQFGANFSQKVQSVLPTLESNKHLSILDIGVGMGAVDIALQRHYGKKVSFIYMDKSRFEPKRMSLISHGSQSGFGEQHPFYGNLECARQIAWMNGLQEVKLIELGSGHGISDLDEHSVDIVLSSSSWGFHYPIEMYISDVMRVLKVEGLILVSLRTGTDGFTILSRHGLDCKYLSQDAHREWVKCSRAPQKNLKAEDKTAIFVRGNISILWEMGEFYDFIDIVKLVGEAIRLGYPTTIFGLGLILHVALVDFDG